MRHSRGAAASWQLRGLLQQQQETWHFECIVPMSTMHFRDVILMGLCSGRLALARVGNFCVYQAKTWHQRSDNWLHLCKSVSVLLFRVFCLVSMRFFFFQIQHDFASASHQGLLKRFLSYRLDRLVPSLPQQSWWLAGHNDNKNQAFRQFIQLSHGIKQKIKMCKL